MRKSTYIAELDCALWAGDPARFFDLPAAWSILGLDFDVEPT